MISIDRDLCIGCGLCAKDCTARNIIVEDGKAAPKKDCFLCGHCVAVCPQNAVSIPGLDASGAESIADLTYPTPEETLLRIKARRSIRSYAPTPVSDGDLEMLLQAGRYTPTAKNRQNNYFVFVRDGLAELKEKTWAFVDAFSAAGKENLSPELQPYAGFNKHRKADPANDNLFFNAPVVLFVSANDGNKIDAGLAGTNIENMALSLGMGALYNGYLARLTDRNEELKAWLGLEGRHIDMCMLLGYPAVSYRRTAPREQARFRFM